MIFTLGNWLGLIRILANVVFNMLRYGENESIRKKRLGAEYLNQQTQPPTWLREQKAGHFGGSRGTHHKFLAKLKKT